MKKILLVDDSLFMRKILRDILCRRYEIVEADTGAGALQKYASEKPDLVLLDIVMSAGEEEGISVLKKIKGTEPQACIIMISAVGQDAVVNECKKFGANDYITKPFDEKKVLERVEKALA